MGISGSVIATIAETIIEAIELYGKNDKKDDDPDDPDIK